MTAAAFALGRRWPRTRTRFLASCFGSPACVAVLRVFFFQVACCGAAAPIGEETGTLTDREPRLDLGGRVLDLDDQTPIVVNVIAGQHKEPEVLRIGQPVIAGLGVITVIPSQRPPERFPKLRIQGDLLVAGAYVGQPSALARKLNRPF